jgi:hypothetical protein
VNEAADRKKPKGERAPDEVLARMDWRPWVGPGLLALFALAYCWSALRAPYWVGNDAWSDLLPVVHYRISILNHHSLPVYTELWYGGRAQWANPLWNFLYLPATLIWLIAPLDWGTRIVYFSHFLFALFAGRKLASLFLQGEGEKIGAALVLCSPVFAAFPAGQTEKILSWPWILLGLYCLYNPKLSMPRRGLTAGICLGIVPLTGSNYFTLYTGILMAALLIIYKNRNLLGHFALGSMLGLLHLPSVAYLVGQARGNPEGSIADLSLSFLGILSSLGVGLAKPMGWETWAPIGVPMVILFFKSIALRIKASISLKRLRVFSATELAWLSALLILVLLATGVLYRGQHVFDLFRVPARAMPFVALAAALFVFEYLRDQAGPAERRIYLLAAALQIGIVSFLIRPPGAPYGPYDPAAQELAEALRADRAKTVWITMQEFQGKDKLNNMYIQTVLTRNELSLPNVYYGDMGQEIDIQGNHCGYSFDHLVTLNPVPAGGFELAPDIEWSNTRGRIPAANLVLVREVDVNGNPYKVYRVVCGP